ncbi:unnamed protein product [Adineta steineri]|uniref:Uncharacterized protein n=1 Tax=Adineta steineri TaxID=433720 RepID=A0A818NQA1_9BILA|nr:unnamed protein product [Adineta steineri]CAF3611068.1 unnamed protein product [Adineta steineri]
MNFLYYIFILLLPFSYTHPLRYPKDLNHFLNMYTNQRETNSDRIDKRFGSSRQLLFRLMPLHYQQPVVQNPVCLPRIWTCGPDLPPCCPGLMCYGGNAKRGRHCVVQG